MTLNFIQFSEITHLSFTSSNMNIHKYFNHNFVDFLIYDRKKIEFLKSILKVRSKLLGKRYLNIGNKIFIIQLVHPLFSQK